MGDGEKHETCPHCNENWASQAHYDMQSCGCIHQTDNADAHTVLFAVADCAKRWVPDARLIGSVRAVDIVTACAEATNLLKLSGVEESDGFWKSCSGCHETIDGQETGHYPFSKTFNCVLGAGCSECGGLGAIWDDVDYEDMGAVLSAEMRNTTKESSQ